MKKILSFSLALLVLLLSLTISPVFADSAHTGCVINCGDYTIETTGNNECTIIEYKGTERWVKIPETLDAYTVTAIGDDAFAYNYYLSSVTIPNTIKTIGNNAFFYCYNLGGVTIPDSVESIGEKAFGFNRRTFDTESCSYTYKSDFAFTIFATKGSAGAVFAEENGLELNKDDHYNDYASGIYFEIPDEWKTFNKIYCHIWDLETGKSFTTWQSENERCSVFYDHVQYNVDTTGGFTLNYDTIYAVVFSTDTGEVTAPAVCFGNCLSSYHLTTDGTYITTNDDDVPRLQAKWWTGREYADMSAYEKAFGLNQGTTATKDEEKPTPTYDEALPWGDANCDGDVNIKDATAIQKHIAEIKPLSDQGVILSNYINKNIKLSIQNATGLQKYCAGLTTFEKIGKPAVTRVWVETPHAWERQDIYVLSWSNEDDITTVPVIDNVANIPIYNNNVALTCNDYTTRTWTLDFYTNDNDGNSNYVCEVFHNSDNEVAFIWTLWD